MKNNTRQITFLQFIVTLKYAEFSEKLLKIIKYLRNNGNEIYNIFTDLLMSVTENGNILVTI